MFKKESSANQIVSDMENNLSSSNYENENSTNIKKAKALELLSNAANYFEMANLHAESELLTKLITKMATNIENFKDLSTDELENKFLDMMLNDESLDENNS